ncbi:MAG: class I SAM-dependent methyltransferase, partial [Pseudomonadales bacterium]|nr:class I SAM-dependent methyltransferase [Pseudomonadales bacterium]
CLRDSNFEQRLAALGRSEFVLPCDVVDNQEALSSHSANYVLSLENDRIQLAPRDKSMGNPVVVDFASGTIGFRGRQNVRQELSVKAVFGRDKKSAPNVLDMTGGLGRDSFILACAGCNVTTLERNPLVFLLLSDGLYRAETDFELQAVVQYIDLHYYDAVVCDAVVAPDIANCDVVYMDPMFPERTKSALVKKEMRVFRDVVGEDVDVHQLFEQARNVARKKVIVKRPRKSAFIKDKKPTYSVEGRSSRFDVYQV